MDFTRKITIFIISSILAFLFGFFFFDKATLVILFKNYAYYFILFAFIFWIFSLIKAILNANKEKNINLSEYWYDKGKEFWSFHKIAIFTSFLLMILGVIICKPDFRILADETNLLSVSQTMLESKDPSVVVSAITNSLGEKAVIESSLDKRPLFYPFLLSLVHSSIGYRSENAFIFNFLVSVICLFLFYFLVQIKYGRMWGITGMICLVAYPLFLVYANSAGFEVFNLTCSLIIFLNVYYFLKNPNAITSEIMLLWLPLLSQSRYESAITVFIVLPLFFYKLPKEEYSNLSYKFYLFPLLFLPIAWQRLLDNALFWQVENSEEPFGINSLINNTGKAFEFFFSGIDSYGIICVFSFIAVAGLYLVIKECFNNQKSPIHRPFFIITALFILMHALSRFLYSLCDLTVDMERRLGIIFIPMIIYLSIIFLSKLSEKLKIHKLYYLVLSIFILSFYWPDAANMLCVRDFALFREYKLVREFIYKNYSDKKNLIIIAARPNLYTPLGYNAISFENYSNLPELVNYIAMNKLRIITIQYLIPDTLKPYLGNSMPANLAGKTVFEEKIDNDYTLRISSCN